MKKGLFSKAFAFIMTVCFMSGMSGMVLAANEELMISDPMRNFSKMYSYAKNLVYNDFTKTDDVNFSADRLGQNAIMKFSGGPDDSWISYECAGATKIVIEASIVNATGNPYYPNHMKFFTSVDEQTWTPITSKNDVRDYPAKWTDVTYTVTNIPATAKYFKILLWVPDELPPYASRVYNMDMYGVKPTVAVSQAPTSSAASIESSTPGESTLPSVATSSIASSTTATSTSTDSEEAIGEVDDNNNTGLIIGIIAGIIVLAGAGLAAYFVIIKKKKNSSASK